MAERSARPLPFPAETSATAGRWNDLLILFALGVGVRLLLIFCWPVPFGNDSSARLFFHDRLFLAHWLPLTQLLVMAGGWLSHNILVTRLIFIVTGALAGCAFYLFLRTLAHRPAALAGGLLFSLNSLYVILSLMPYQGPLFLGLFYASWALLFRSPVLSSRLGALLFGLACLTRYEGWFAVPCLIAARTYLAEVPDSKAWSVRRLAGSTLLFSWGPLVWILLSRYRWGSPSGFLFHMPDQSFYGWNPHFDLLWVSQYALRHLYWILIFGTPLVLLSFCYLAEWRQGRRPLPLSLKLLLGNLALVLLFFFFVIGKQQETVFRFVLFPLSVALVFTSLGLESAMGWLARRRPRWVGRRQSWVLPAILVSVLALISAVRVRGLNRDPAYRDPYLVAQFLNAELRENESVLIIAERRRDLADAAPVGYQRIAALSPSIRSKILSAALIEETEPDALQSYLDEHRVGYVVIFTGFQPWLEADRFFIELVPRTFPPVYETESAIVYRTTGLD